jgi:hypothetical protein
MDLKLYIINQYYGISKFIHTSDIFVVIFLGGNYHHVVHVYRPHEAIQWTDGCGRKYKSKGPSLDITCSLDDLCCLVERNNFRSRHGKGPSNGESAVIE